jgi:hypothetical protein
VNLQEELITKEDYQRALYTVSLEIEECIEKVNFSKKQIRNGLSAWMLHILREDIKSKELQQAFLIHKDASYGAIFDLYDIHLEEYNHKLRLREDILRLMSMSQSELKLI